MSQATLGHASRVILMAQATSAQAVNIVQQAPLGQHQLRIKTNTNRDSHGANRRRSAPPGEQHRSKSSAHTGVLGTHTTASASLPTKRQNGYQLEQPELKQVKTEDSESIVIPLGMDTWMATVREQGVLN